MKHYLIIGNGVAGTTAAENIRKNDVNGTITLLTDENVPFYYRIRLNEYLSGDITEQQLMAKKPEWYTDKNIQLVAGLKAAQADREKKTVTTDRGDTFHYDTLLFANGSSSFVPPIPGADRKGVFTLRTLADAREIIAYSENKDKVILIGGGLLGLEAGNAFRKKGKQVSVVEFFPRLLPRQLDQTGAEILKKMLQEMGFHFYLGQSTKAIEGSLSVENIVLEDQKKIPAEIVIISAGVRPNIELAKSMGLVCDKGIVVDDSLRTNDPDIFAAGDVAEHKKFCYGIWPAAMEQGKIAGENMAEGEALYRGSVMANRLKVVGIDLASAGEIDADNTFECRVEKSDTRYKKIVFDKDKHIIGCIMLGDTSGFGTMTKAISEKQKIDAVKL